MKTLSLNALLTFFFGVIFTNAFSKPENLPYCGRLEIGLDTGKKAQPNKNLQRKDSTDAPSDSAGMSKYRGKSYVFQKSIKVFECDEIGEIDHRAKQPIAPKGTTFTVQGVTKNGQLIISFWIWRLDKPLPAGLDSVEKANIDSSKKNKLFRALLDSANTRKKQKQLFEQMDIIAKRKSFNFKKYADLPYVPVSIDSVNDNKRYFLIGKDTLKNLCYEYKEEKKWQINYGTLVTPFKLRFNKFAFSNNLSVGGGIYYQRKIDSVWSYDGIVALSLSSVTLDATSTNINPPLTSSTSRPAFSPSLHGVFTYKNINFIVGIGWDILNIPNSTASATNPEAGWIYNGKPWLGIGFGFNLFNNSTPKGTPNDSGQKSPGK